MPEPRWERVPGDDYAMSLGPLTGSVTWTGVMPEYYAAPSTGTLTWNYTSATTTVYPYPPAAYTYDTGTWNTLLWNGQPLLGGELTTIDDAVRDVRAERALRVEERAASRTEAVNRATELLMALLSPQQREQYRLRGDFEVIGSAGNLYRIRRGTSGNIDWIRPDGEVGGRLCAHPTMDEHWLPEQDVALSQMLALTTDEPAFIRMANVHVGSRPPIPVG